MLVPKWRSVLDLVTTVTMLLGSASIVALVATRYFSMPVRTPHATVDVIPKDPISLDRATVRGNAAATIGVLEFADYQCPFCAQIERTAIQPVVREYVEPGKIRLAYLELPLTQIHPLALNASKTALCAGNQGKYWPVHDALFGNHDKLDETHVRSLALAASVDVAALSTCLKDDAVGKRVAADALMARTLGVSGTPTLFFGIIQADGRLKVTKRLHGMQPIDAIRNILNEMIKSTAPSSTR